MYRPLSLARERIRGLCTTLMAVFAAVAVLPSAVSVPRTSRRADPTSSLTVFVSPDYTETNPYQRNLVEALGGCGVNVVSVDEHGPLMPIAALQERGLPDVLHLHWLHPFLVGRNPGYTLLKGPLFLAQVAALRALGVRVVWTAHNVVEHEHRSPRVERALKHALVRLGADVVVHCERAVESIRRSYRLPDRYGDRIHVVPHGHYAANYENAISRAAARKDLGFDDEFVFLFFGRVCPYKNVVELIEAFEGIDDPNARLLIAGNPKTEEIGAAVADAAVADDRVETTLSFVPDDRVQYYMNAADAVVLPFGDVLTSGSAILAMSFGKTVVVPDRGCLHSLVPDEGGLLYRGESQAAIRAAMQRAIDADVEAIGRANRRRALSRDWEDIARRTARVYTARRSPSSPPTSDLSLSDP